MSAMIPDPDDDGQWLIGNAAVGPFGVQVGVMTLGNVHPTERCAGRPCVVHNPSPHHMREWPLNWREDRRIMERICRHGVGHPDPDDLAYQVSIGNKWQARHGCCGCCAVTP